MTERSYSGTIVAGIVFAALVSGMLYRYWPSQEREIRRHLSNLSEALSLSTAESEAVRLTRFAAMREYFSEDVSIRFDDQEIRSRDTALDRLRSIHPPPGGVAVEFVDVKVQLGGDERSARVALTAKVSVSSSVKSGESVLETRSVDVTMMMWDGDWVITSVDAGRTR